MESEAASLVSGRCTDSEGLTGSQVLGEGGRGRDDQHVGRGTADNPVSRKEMMCHVEAENTPFYSVEGGEGGSKDSALGGEGRVLALFKHLWEVSPCLA